MEEGGDGASRRALTAVKARRRSRFCTHTSPLPPCPLFSSFPNPNESGPLFRLSEPLVGEVLKLLDNPADVKAARLSCKLFDSASRSALPATATLRLDGRTMTRTLGRVLDWARWPLLTRIEVGHDFWTLECSQGSLLLEFLGGCDPSSEACAALSRVTALAFSPSLRFRPTTAADVGPILRALPALRTLVVQCKDDAAVQAVADNAPRLERLCVTSPRFRSASAEAVNSMRGLRALAIGTWDDGRLEVLRRIECDRLTSLDVCGGVAVGEQWHELFPEASPFDQLRELRGVSLRSADMGAVADALPRLEVLAAGLQGDGWRAATCRPLASVTRAYLHPRRGFGGAPLDRLLPSLAFLEISTTTEASGYGACLNYMGISGLTRLTCLVIDTDFPLPAGFLEGQLRPLTGLRRLTGCFCDSELAAIRSELHGSKELLISAFEDPTPSRWSQLSKSFH